MVDEPLLARPILFVLEGLDGGSISDIKQRSSPNWFNLISTSKDIIISDIDIKVSSINENPARNGDGWDTYRSDTIGIQDSWVGNSENCVSFKPNSTNIIVQDMHCNGSHGISVGSLGQYAGEFEIAENLYTYNISMSDAGDGAKMKICQDCIDSMAFCRSAFYARF